MACQVSDIFDVRYGHSLELNALSITSPKDGIPFVSRKVGDNGISAFVEPIDDVEPAPAGDISCALGGNGVLTTHIQELPFYVGRDVAILRPKQDMTKAEILYYCLCIKHNRYRYSYGRQANKTLAMLAVPPISEIPKWVNSIDVEQFDGSDSPLADDGPPQLTDQSWKEFRYDDIFQIKKGRRLTKEKMAVGTTPFIGAIDANNGNRQCVSASPNHQKNTITVNYNGSVAEAFYQPEPYWASDDVNVLYPKFEMNAYSAMFLCTLIRQEKFRFNYGRKWHLGRMNESIIRLPVLTDGQPDWEFMESYVKALPYSVSL
jgi:restriction endonuclease S subunit